MKNSTQNKFRFRITAIALACALMFSCLPITGFADTDDGELVHLIGENRRLIPENGKLKLKSEDPEQKTDAYQPNALGSLARKATLELESNQAFMIVNMDNMWIAGQASHAASARGDAGSILLITPDGQVSGHGEAFGRASASGAIPHPQRMGEKLDGTLDGSATIYGNISKMAGNDAAAKSSTAAREGEEGSSRTVLDGKDSSTLSTGKAGGSSGGGQSLVIPKTGDNGITVGQGAPDLQPKVSVDALVEMISRAEADVKMAGKALERLKNDADFPRLMDLINDTVNASNTLKTLLLEIEKDAEELEIPYSCYEQLTIGADGATVLNRALADFDLWEEETAPQQEPTLDELIAKTKAAIEDAKAVKAQLKVEANIATLEDAINQAEDGIKLLTADNLEEYGKEYVNGAVNGYIRMLRAAADSLKAADADGTAAQLETNGNLSVYDLLFSLNMDLPSLMTAAAQSGFTVNRLIELFNEKGITLKSVMDAVAGLNYYGMTVQELIDAGILNNTAAIGVVVNLVPDGTYGMAAQVTALDGTVYTLGGAAILDNGKQVQLGKPTDHDDMTQQFGWVEMDKQGTMAFFSTINSDALGLFPGEMLTARDAVIATENGPVVYRFDEYGNCLYLGTLDELDPGRTGIGKIYREAGYANGLPLEMKLNTFPTDYLAHIFETTVLQSPGCETEGLLLLGCTTEGCPLQMTQKIAPIGHLWEAASYTWGMEEEEWICTAEHVCARYHSHTETEKAVAEGVNVKPTCCKAGKTTYTASFENPSFETQQWQEVIPPTGEHNLVLEPGTGDSNTHTYTCSICGTEIKEEHSWGGWGNTTQGKHARSCEVCGREETEDHTWDYTDNKDGKHTCKCPACGAEETEDHAWSDWEEDGQGGEIRRCSKCGATETANPHIWSEWTDNKEGKHVRTCSDCGATETKDHSWGAWTATEDGKHAHTCSACGATETADHSWGTWTATEDGKHAHTCSDCGATETADHSWGAGTATEDGKKHTHTCSVCGLTETADHSWGTWTATEDGKHAHTCSDCGATETADHSWGDWEEFGVYQHTHKCKDCGAEETGTHSYDGWRETEDKTGHYRACKFCGKITDEGVHQYGHNGPATCTEKATCAKCGMDYGEINPENHNLHLEHWEKKEPTCEEAGNIDCYYCTACNKYFSDWEGKEEISADEAIIPATGHEWETGWTWGLDDNTHWHACTHEGCNGKADYGKHTGGTATCVSGPKCEICGVEYGSIASNNHSWPEKPEWVWAANYSSATATLTCKNNSAHTIKQTDDKIVSDVTLNPDIVNNKSGKQNCTATVTLNGEDYSDTKTDVVYKYTPDTSGIPTDLLITAEDNVTCGKRAEAWVGDFRPKYKGNPIEVQKPTITGVGIDEDSGKMADKGDPILITVTFEPLMSNAFETVTVDITIQFKR